MSNKISSLNLTGAVQKILKKYGSECRDSLFESVTEVSKAAAANLRRSSQSEFGNGEYAKGWTAEVHKARLTTEAVVYGKGLTASLAHLLEHGHVTRNGTGRTFRPTPAHEHIAPVNDWAQDELIDRTIRKLEG